jgi:hypothetical protein
LVICSCTSLHDSQWIHFLPPTIHFQQDSARCLPFQKTFSYLTIIPVWKIHAFSALPVICILYRPQRLAILAFRASPYLISCPRQGTTQCLIIGPCSLRFSHTFASCQNQMRLPLSRVSSSCLCYIHVVLCLSDRCLDHIVIVPRSPARVSRVLVHYGPETVVALEAKAVVSARGVDRTS